MSSNIGPNFNNKINARPNPFSKGAKTTTYTRALGSTSIFATGSGGWRGAARGVNPYDTQSMNAARYARMRASANVYAGRNTGSFGALAQQSGADEMSDMEKAMMYMQLGMMGLELTKGITDMFGAGKSNKTSVNTLTPESDGPAGLKNKEKTGKTGKTSADAKNDVDTKKASLDILKTDLCNVNLAGIAGCDTTNLSNIKDKYGIDIDLTKLSSMNNITFSQDVPNDAEIDSVKKQAEFVSTSLKSATTGIGKLTESATTTRAKLTQMQNVPVDQRDASWTEQNEQLETELKKIESAKAELETLKTQLETANTSLNQLANDLPKVVKEYNDALENQKEVEQKEVKELKELTDEVNSIIGKLADGKKVEKNSNKLGSLASQITALKTLVLAHVNQDAAGQAVQAAETALSRISQMNIKVGGKKQSAPATIDGDAVSDAQLAEMNKKYGVNLKIDEETVIAGQKFKITKDGQFWVNGNPESGQKFFEQIASKQKDVQYFENDIKNSGDYSFHSEFIFQKQDDGSYKLYSSYDRVNNKYELSEGTFNAEQLASLKNMDLEEIRNYAKSQNIAKTYYVEDRVSNLDELNRFKNIPAGRGFVIGNQTYIKQEDGTYKLQDKTFTFSQLQRILYQDQKVNINSLGF